jgi:colicin import membrane protein
VAVSGLGLFYATTGGVLLWSGFKGQTIKETITAITSGNTAALSQQGTETVSSPTVSTSSTPAAQNVQTGSGVTGPADNAAAAAGVSTVTEAANKAAGALIAASFGWAGSQFTALDSIAMTESGWDNLAQNSSSGAFGIAQALGHGTAGTAGKYGNNYGADYGLTAASAVAANNGSATPQITWMCGYIKAQYGTPEAAWAFHQANGYY